MASHLWNLASIIESKSWSIMTCIGNKVLYVPLKRKRILFERISDSWNFIICRKRLIRGLIWKQDHDLNQKLKIKNVRKDVPNNFGAVYKKAPKFAALDGRCAQSGNKEVVANRLWHFRQLTLSVTSCNIRSWKSHWWAFCRLWEGSKISQSPYSRWRPPLHIVRLWTRQTAP